MIANLLPLVDWTNGILQAVIMFGTFLALFVMLVLFMRGGKKKE